MRLAPSLLALVALAAVSEVQAQQSFPTAKTPGPRPSRPAPARAERRTTITPLQIDTLPTTVTLPAPLDDNKKPPGFPLSFQEATDVQFIPGDAPAYARWKLLKTGAVYGRLDLGSGGSVRLARDIAANYNRGSTFSVGCSQDGGPPANIYRVMAIRWERVQQTPGGATLELNDGWFDGRDCKVYLERRTSIPLKAVMQVEETPVLFASRSEDTLLLHFPPGARVVSDVEGVLAHAGAGGALWSVQVPIRRGQAASVLAELDPRQAAQWLQGVQRGAAPRPASGAFQRPLQLGVEILQTVRDQSPSVLVRATL